MKITEIELLCHDIAETADFYSQILRLPVNFQNQASLTIVAGESVLTFKKGAFPHPVYHFAFNIPNYRLNEAQRWVSSKTKLIKHKNECVIDFKNWNAKSFYFFDNNGNVLEFIARFDIDNATSKPFDASGILSVSEIALVSNNVPELTGKLVGENDFSYFQCQTPRDDFSVLGDHDGLIIISGAQRNWFPTGIRAQQYPVRITVEKEKKLITINYS